MTRSCAMARGSMGPPPALLAVVLALVLLLAAPAAALDVEFTPQPVKREILALYDSRHESTPWTTRIHKFAEMPLNFLGFKLDYVDINGPLPGPEQLARYRGMMSWLIEPMRKPEAYLRWLDRATATGIRFALLANVAPPEPEYMRPVVNRILGHIGLRETGEFVNVTHRARIIRADPDMVGFERPLDKALPDFGVMTATRSDVIVHLSAEAPGREGKLIAALVATSRNGGYASDEFTIYFEPNTDRLRWTLNPFTFFRKAFGEERLPIPDVTTLSGRRIYFSHIDGDGWNNVSEIEGHREAHTPSSEVVAREAIEAYPDLPVTVGLIAGDADASIGGTKAAVQTAKRLFALPQVEVATHTYTHPFAWQYFETYDRAEEMAKLEKAQRTDRTVWEKVRLAAVAVGSGKEVSAERPDKYIAGSDDLPRSYLKNPFDLETEIKGALAFSERLAPQGKKARLMLWSGDTLPFEAAIRATREAGVRNMNGGDSRLDPEYPSVFYVPPIARPVGKERQIYSGNSNENTYTNDWTGPYFGYFNLDRTLDRTEQPRRLKPFNLYYHMYIGEKASSLAALKHFLDRARSSEVVPVAASRYAAIADDFFGVEITQVDTMGWAIANRGELQTVRFDAAADVMLDMAQSQGVLGANRTNGSLYVSLDSAVATARVALKRATIGLDEPIETMPRLVSSRWTFSDRKGDACSSTLNAQGFGPGDMLWEVAPGSRWRIRAERGGARLAEIETAADGQGHLKIRLEVSAQEPLQIGIQCHG